MGDSDEIRARVEGNVHGFRVVKKRYFSDSGVELDVEVPFTALAELIPAAPPNPDPVVAKPPTDKSHAKDTSVVVDARGLKATSALAPRLLDGSGAVVYSSDLLTYDVRKMGVVHYAATPEEAKSHMWLGDHPWTIKATKAIGSDLVLSDADAKVLRDGPPAYLRSGHVIILTP
jgi:hypothetical protein